MQPGEEVSHWEREWDGKVKGERQVSCSSVRGRAFCENAQKGAKLIFYVSTSRKDRSVLCVQEGLFLSAVLSLPPFLLSASGMQKGTPFQSSAGFAKFGAKMERFLSQNTAPYWRAGNEMSFYSSTCLISSYIQKVNLKPQDTTITHIREKERETGGRGQRE